MTNGRHIVARLCCFSMVLWTSLAFVAQAHVADASAPRINYIIQSASADTAAAAVSHVGGSVAQRLSIINGVAAVLDARAVAYLRTVPGTTLHEDQRVQVASHAAEPGVVPTAPQVKETGTKDYLLYPAAATGALGLRQTKVATPNVECKNGQTTTPTKQNNQDVQGGSVTVAIVDSGVAALQDSKGWLNMPNESGTLYAQGSGRCIIYRDFLPRTAANNNAGAAAGNSTDQYGHGTHVLATIADNRKTKMSNNSGSSAVGVAPDVNLVVARALGKDGSGAYSDVINAIQWIVANKTKFNVRVLNLSLYAPVGGPYWMDPMNQAVMKAWQAGIVVVAAAGNAGPVAGTITAPGNIPYVITAGAIKSGRYSASGSDELAQYSSRGPTESAFVKPDVLVPASRTIAPMPDDSSLALSIPEARVQDKSVVSYGFGKYAKPLTYFQLSGTSMAAAQISGIVALMLQAHPELTNNQVKFRLMATARPAVDTQTGQPLYSIWEQGAGLVNTQEAVLGSVANTNANAGLDIAVDLDPNSTQHGWGNTVWDSGSGQFRMVDPSNGQAVSTWAGGFTSWSGGFTSWSGGFTSWSGGFTSWSGGFTSWSGGLNTWAGSNQPWVGTTAPPSTQTASHSELLTND